MGKFFWVAIFVTFSFNPTLPNVDLIGYVLLLQPNPLLLYAEKRLLYAEKSLFTSTYVLASEKVKATNLHCYN